MASASPEYLKKPLLTRDPDTMLLKMNFDPEVKKIIHKQANKQTNKQKLFILTFIARGFVA